MVQSECRVRRNLVKHLNTLQAQAMSKSKRSTRNSQSRQYAEFCKSHHLKRVSAKPSVIALFVAFLHRKGLEYNSIINYIHSLLAFHHNKNLQSPNLNHFLIKQSLAGVQRSSRERPHKKHPLLPVHFTPGYRPLKKLPKRTQYVFWVVYLVRLFSLLRKATFSVISRRKLFCEKKTSAFVTIELS